jgi:flagellar basal-body rod protein FlgF
VLRTLQTARQSLHLEQTRIDNLANNLANAATSGFRQILTRVTEQAPPQPGAPGTGEVPVTGEQLTPQELSRALPPSAAPDGWVRGRELVMSQAVDMRPGPLSATGRNLDVAISGPGFFVVRDPEGNEHYTRDGSFNLDASGQLVNAGGLPVLGTGGPIQASGGALSIDAQGTVRVDGSERGRLRLATFEHPHQLLHRGDGVLAAPPGLVAAEVPAGEATLLQGHLEGSNVDTIRTLVDMIAAQRAFEIGAKVLQANDEMLGQSVNTLGRNT